RVLGAISTIEIPWDTGDFRLMDRKVVRALSSLPEKTRFIRGMVPWLGFRQCGIPLDRDARELGDSTYTVRKLLALALDGLLAFSVAPLLFLPFAGLILAALGFLGFVISLVVTGARLEAAAILSFVTMLSGLIIVAIGIVAVYLSRVLEEVRARPTYLVGLRMGTGFMDSVNETERGRIERNESSKEVSSVGSSTH
ncbi:MAG: glycosyltransferase, partial [Cyanobacteria bacterium]|nr:glycosyltransferase [Cyanobacteriota bacterium]